MVLIKFVKKIVGCESGILFEVSWAKQYQNTNHLLKIKNGFHLPV
jgi:hypothetical protein